MSHPVPRTYVLQYYYYVHVLCHVYTAPLTVSVMDSESASHCSRQAGELADRKEEQLSQHSYSSHGFNFEQRFGQTKIGIIHEHLTKLERLYCRDY